MNTKVTNLSTEMFSPSGLGLSEQTLTPYHNRIKHISHISAVAALFILPLSTSLLYVALLISLFSWLFLKPWQEKLAEIKQNPGTQVCLGFFILFLLGSIYSAGNITDILASLSKMSKLLFVICLVPIFKDKIWRYRALMAFISAMLLSLVLGLVKLNSEWPLLYLKYASPTSVFKNYIDINLMMAFSVFILAHLVTQPIAWQKKLLFSAIALLMTFYVFWWSEGRSGYFVFIALWTVFCFQHLKFRNSLIGLIVLTVVLGCAIQFSDKFQQRLFIIPQQIQQYKEGQQFTSVGQRLQYLHHVFVLAKERPVLGFGTGSLKSVYGAYAKEHQLFQTQNPHNEYLNIFFQLGTMGLFAFISLFVLLFYVSFKMPKLEGSLLQGLCMAMMVGCLGNSWLMDFTSGYWFVLMTAICCGSYSKKLSHE